MKCMLMPGTQSAQGHCRIIIIFHRFTEGSKAKQSTAQHMVLGFVADLALEATWWTVKTTGGVIYRYAWGGTDTDEQQQQQQRVEDELHAIDERTDANTETLHRLEAQVTAMQDLLLHRRKHKTPAPPQCKEEHTVLRRRRASI